MKFLQEITAESRGECRYCGKKIRRHGLGARAQWKTDEIVPSAFPWRCEQAPNADFWLARAHHKPK